MLRVYNTGKLVVNKANMLFNMFVVKKKFSIRSVRVDNGDTTFTITETNTLTGDSVAKTYNDGDEPEPENVILTVEIVHNSDGTITESVQEGNGEIETKTYEPVE